VAERKAGGIRTEGVVEGERFRQARREEGRMGLQHSGGAVWCATVKKSGGRSTGQRLKVERGRATETRELAARSRYLFVYIDPHSKHVPDTSFSAPAITVGGEIRDAEIHFGQYFLFGFITNRYML
jgi:hypothetical protein